VPALRGGGKRCGHPGPQLARAPPSTLHVHIRIQVDRKKQRKARRHRRHVAKSQSETSSLPADGRPFLFSFQFLNTIEIPKLFRPPAPVAVVQASMVPPHRFLRRPCQATLTYWIRRRPFALFWSRLRLVALASNAADYCMSAICTAIYNCRSILSVIDLSMISGWQY
jgi:hypothetical protein